ncbi:peroxisomal biogenesis factor 11 [Phakopsora pachyrhizi]|uniref:Peroxisomal biogenesis factor 11 n=1 Tax=Phakopsora pachyrhizi TaxID=170000 RepID=A0AAV0BF79_PHAPC|nr:peroxisomal biogenesis factor 11 [Phakopsora pachyrhizi]
MASVANQVVFHPLITSSLKVGSTTVGRDKLYRTIQYFSRFLAWYIQNYGEDKKSAVRFNNLKSALGLSRKLMRLGKPIEHLQAALKATKEVSDPVSSVCGIGRQLSYAIYLYNDMIIWAEKIKFINVDKIRLEHINKRAAQFWFTGITLNLINGLYKHQQTQCKLKRLDNKSSIGDHEKEDRRAQIRSLSSQVHAIRLQLLQDLCDILSPSSTLGFHSLNDGVIGSAGVLSSLLGLRAQVKKVLG